MIFAILSEANASLMMTNHLRTKEIALKIHVHQEECERQRSEETSQKLSTMEY